MARRTDQEITRAIDRLRTERQIPLAELAGEVVDLNGVGVRLTALVLRRWGSEGKAGVYLDTLYCKRRQCWVTSRAALARFERDLADKVAARVPAG